MNAESIKFRKLQPIYNALDAHQWKRALKLCEKKDVERWPITKALKANALIKLGGGAQAMELCREVQATCPTEENTLATLKINYRLLEAYSEMTALYEAAAKQQPKDPRFLTELFLAHIMRKDYAKAQQAATKLYKLDTYDHKYIIWAAVTQVMQVERGGNKALMVLAERILEKALTEKSVLKEKATGEELSLLVEILKAQGKEKQALECLDKYGEDADEEVVNTDMHDQGSAGHGTSVRMTLAERKELQAQLHTTCGNTTAALSLWRELILRLPDQWSYWTSYLDLIDIDVVEQEQALTHQMQQQHPKYRGPYLAEMYLLKHLAEVKGLQSPLPKSWVVGEASTVTSGSSDGLSKGGAMTMLGGMCSLIRRYSDRFCTKLCALDDMAPYIRLCTGGAAEEVALVKYFQAGARESMYKCVVDGGELQLPDPSVIVEEEERALHVKKLHRYILHSQLLHLLEAGSGEGKGNNSSGNATSSLSDKVGNFALQFRATQCLNAGLEGGLREVQVGDRLVTLTAEALQRAQASALDGSLDAYMLGLEVTAFLEYGVRTSPFNCRLKAQAMKSYEALGSFQRGVALYNDIDTRLIQVESLSWMLYPGCLRCGLYSEAVARSRDIITLHKSSTKDSAEYMGKAFLCGNYSKVIEIASFQEEQMGCSLQLAMAKSELIALSLLLEHHTKTTAKSYLQELSMGMASESLSLSDEELSSLQDNRDFSIGLPLGAELVHVLGDPAEKEKGVLRVKSRILLVRLLRSALQAEGDLHQWVSGLREHLEGMGYKGLGRTDADAPLKQLEGIKLEPRAGKELQVAVREQGWRVMLHLADAVAESFAASPGSERAAPAKASGGDSGGMTAAVTRAADQVQQLASLLLGDSSKRCIYQAPKGSLLASAPLQPSWVAAISKMLTDVWGSIPLLFQALKEKVPSSKKKGKKVKKGKEGKEPGEIDAGRQEALARLGDELIKFLAGLAEALKAEVSLRESGKGAKAIGALLEGQAGYEATLKCLVGRVEQQEGEMQGWKLEASIEKVAELVAGGQQLALERLLDVVKKKLGTFRSLV